MCGGGSFVGIRHKQQHLKASRGNKKQSEARADALRPRSPAGVYILLSCCLYLHISVSVRRPWKQVAACDVRL